MTAAAERVTNAFHEAPANEDWGALHGVLTEDASWILPGDNAMPDPAKDADVVMEQARFIASYNMRLDLRHVLVSRLNMALYQHNTAERAGQRFGEEVATVCSPRGERIRRIETFVSDLDGSDRFFAKKFSPNDAG